jgi:tetratricopeptide (TPR) repeat protein
LHREIAELDEVLAAEGRGGQESGSNSCFSIHTMIEEINPRRLTTTLQGDPIDLVSILSDAAATTPDTSFETSEPVTPDAAVATRTSGPEAVGSDSQTQTTIKKSDEEATPLIRNTIISVDPTESHDGIFVPEFGNNKAKVDDTVAVRIVNGADDGDGKTSDLPQSIPEEHEGAFGEDRTEEVSNRSGTGDAAGTSERDELQKIVQAEPPGGGKLTPQRRKSADEDAPDTSADGPVQSSQTGYVPSISVSTSFEYTDLPLSEVETPKAAGGKARGFSRIDTRSTSKSLGTRAATFWGSSVRKDALESLRTSYRAFTDMDFYKALLMHGAQVISDNARDVPSFYSMHAIFAFLSESERIESPPHLGLDAFVTPEKMVKLSRQCLFRCLVISNQAASTGMLGWLEYGSSVQCLRDIERPFELQHAIACNYAHRQMWRDAEDALKALVMSLEQQFPPYHPTTLAALLDLAAVSSVISNDTFATRTLTRVSQRLSFYLSKVEDSFLSHRDENITDREASDVVFRIDHDRDWLSMLTTFVSTFESDLDREIVRIIGSDCHIALVHHCFVADALAVLANCIATATANKPSRSGMGRDTSRDVHYWRQALFHYRHALEGFTRKLGLNDPNVAAAAYGAARCLRELGRTEEALQVLSKIVKLSEQALVTESSIATKSAPRNAESGRDQKTISFLPQRCFRRRKPTKSRIHSCNRMSSALCFWLMAALTADTNPDERGWDRSLSLLRSASNSLQAGLKEIPKGDASTKAAYIEFLQRLEDEAKNLLGTLKDGERVSGREGKGSSRGHTSRPGYPMSSQQPKLWSV